VSLRERLGLEHPIVGAGLGGGLSRAKLTVAIADAGGLGQLGIIPPPALRTQLNAHRERTTGSVAVNLLLPFSRRAHRDVAEQADAVVTLGDAAQGDQRHLGAPMRVPAGGPGGRKMQARTA
jgi:NAD(P)H-dependent flavin oxidoreductase YrpB (nitropropane dioxygenase family)